MKCCVNNCNALQYGYNRATLKINKYILTSP